MTDSILALAKSLAMAFTLASFGIYQGAVLIAMVAAIARLSYTKEPATLKLLGRFFFMSLGITMLMVHVGLLQGWENELVIVVSGVTAFLCREILEALIKSKDVIIKRFGGLK